MRATDHTGKRYYQLVVIRRSDESVEGRPSWLCKCDCGKEVVVRGFSLSAGNTKSCGCRNDIWKKNLGKRHHDAMQIKYPGNVSAIIRLYAGYKKGASVRNLDFKLDIEEFKAITQQPCYYCGIPPQQVIHTAHSKIISYTHNGIDRINNGVGYVKGNVVACCTICNYAKGTQTLKEFVAWVARAHKNLSTKLEGNKQ